MALYALGALAIITWLLVFILNVKQNVQFVFGIGVLLMLAPVSQVGEGAFGVLARLFGLVAILLACILSRDRAKVSLRTVSATRGFVAGLTAPLFIYLLIATVGHGLFQDFVLYLAGFIVLLLPLILGFVHVPADRLLRAVLGALIVTVVGSLAVGVLVPSIGIAGQRLRGVLNNANALGFMALILAGTALLVYVRFRLVYVTLALLVIVWSGSRASALAFGVLLTLYLLHRKKYGALGAVALGSLAVFVLHSYEIILIEPIDLLFRQTQSRSSSITSAVADFRNEPLLGVGYGQESGGIHSSPLRALSTGGVFGLLAVLLQGVLLVRYSLAAGINCSIFVIGALVHSLFEGWLLSSVSPLLFVFAISWIAIASWSDLHGLGGSFTGSSRTAGTEVGKGSDAKGGSGSGSMAGSNFLLGIAVDPRG